MRFGLPMAYADPAFRACLDEAIETTELVENFDAPVRRVDAAQAFKGRHAGVH